MAGYFKKIGKIEKKRYISIVISDILSLFLYFSVSTHVLLFTWMGLGIKL